MPRNGVPSPVEDHDQVEAEPTAAPKGTGAAPKKTDKKGRDPEVRQHTIYFHNHEWENVLIQSHRHGMDYTEYVTWCVRQGPKLRKGEKPLTQPKPTREAETSAETTPSAETEPSAETGKPAE